VISSPQQAASPTAENARSIDTTQPTIVDLPSRFQPRQQDLLLPGIHDQRQFGDETGRLGFLAHTFYSSTRIVCAPYIPRRERRGFTARFGKKVRQNKPSET